MTATTRREIAEQYLTLPTLNGTQRGIYVRLADAYGVPFGRIVALTGLTPGHVIELLEEAD